MEKKLLEILQKHQGHFISGQQISEELHVSRMTISTTNQKIKRERLSYSNIYKERILFNT